jgi:hypothetical protein
VAPRHRTAPHRTAPALRIPEVPSQLSTSQRAKSLKFTVSALQNEADLLLLRSRLVGPSATSSSARQQLKLIDFHLGRCRNRQVPPAAGAPGSKHTFRRPSSAPSLAPRYSLRSPGQVQEVRPASAVAWRGGQGRCGSRPSSASSSSDSKMRIFEYRPHVARKPPERPPPRERRPPTGQMLRPEPKLRAVMHASRLASRLMLDVSASRGSQDTVAVSDTQWYADEIDRVRKAYRRGTFDPLCGPRGMDGHIARRDEEIFQAAPRDNYIAPGEAAAIAESHVFRGTLH